jgi:folate-dependent phosphoribosylglycinamide formyltransferase PurN
MASGNGSNFQALIDGIAAGAIPGARITRLVVNRSSAYARKRAAAHGIPSTYHNLVSHGFLSAADRGDEEKVLAARDRYDAALARMVLGEEWAGERPRLIVLAGWMHVFGDKFLDPLAREGIRIINLHPALPGEFGGEWRGCARSLMAFFLFSFASSSPPQDATTARTRSSARSTTLPWARCPTTRRASWCTTSSGRWIAAASS